ncbi:unnamed protein product [Citrullus colocynthis]|uniref:Uncharacterized protein n=1 Tax=Citrullus colocynthis TaxID=252529 RepID=A0ABP0Y5K7_9ROSI
MGILSTSHVAFWSVCLHPTYPPISSLKPNSLPSPHHMLLTPSPFFNSQLYPPFSPLLPQMPSLSLHFSMPISAISHGLLLLLLLLIILEATYFDMLMLFHK